jgi:hypothetical protein
VACDKGIRLREVWVDIRPMSEIVSNNFGRLAGQ